MLGPSGESRGECERLESSARGSFASNLRRHQSRCHGRSGSASKVVDVINANDARSEARLDGMKAAIEIIESEQLDPRSLYTHVYDLEDTAQALEMARARPLGFIKAFVRPKPVSEFQARHLLAFGSGA